MHSNTITGFIVSFILLLGFATSAQTAADCDGLIRNGVAALNRQDHARSLELLTRARVMAEKNRWHTQSFLAANNIGNNYFFMLLYGEALENYLQAYTIAARYLKPVQEMIVLNNIAIIYTKEKNYTKAREYFRRAYQTAKENSQGQKAALYAVNLGKLATENGQLAEGRRYILEALPDIGHDPDMQVMANIALAENELYTGNAEKAGSTAQELYRNSKNLNFNEAGSSLLLIISRAYLVQGNYLKALEAAQRILDSQPNDEIRKTAFGLLSDIHQKSGNPQKALMFKDSVLLTTEAMEKIKNNMLLKNSEVNLELINYKNQLRLREENSRWDRKVFYLVLCAAIGVALIVILSMLNILSKHRQKQLLAEANQKTTALELEKEKYENLLLEKHLREKEAIAVLEEQRLRNEIESRNRKLSAKALYLNNRNQLIEELIASLSTIPQIAGNASLERQIKTIKSQLQADDDWDSFLTYFEEVNQDLIAKLRSLHPALTANDIRFISYVYMNMNTKEISSLLNISDDACRKRKERITVKMGLPENAQLYGYLYAIQQKSQ